MNLHLDPDLEKVLDALWRTKSQATREYLELEAKLAIIQELRNLTKELKAIRRKMPHWVKLK